MALIQRVCRRLPSGLVLCSMACLYSALMPRAQAGFELQLDADSVVAIGSQYSIDVNFINSSPATELRGMFAAIAATQPGLTFQGISVPEQAVFDSAVFNYAHDGFPASGNDGLPWGTYIYLKDDGEPTTVASGLAFRLNFSVDGNGDFGLRFVELDADNEYMTGYTVAGSSGEESVTFGFDRLHSADFKIASTPEPSSIALFLAAAGGLGFWRRRRAVATT